MELRFATPPDIPRLLELLRQVGQVHRLGRPDLFREGAQKYTENDLKVLLTDPKRPILVAVFQGEVAGYAFCIVKQTRNDPVLCDHLDLYIDDLCVDAACRGRGIGTALYREAVRLARKLGADSVTLNVWSFNESAMKFYEKCGLKPQKVGLEAILEDSGC